MVTANNREYRRNRKDILKTREEIHTQPEITIDIQEPTGSEHNTVETGVGNTVETMQEQVEKESTMIKSPVVSRVSGRI